MTYELTTSKQRQAFYELYLYAFNKQDDAKRRAFFFYRYDNALTYGIQKEEQLVSALYALPLQVGLKDITYSMYGIGDVMSAPEYSGQGSASTLLRYALTKMNQNKVALSYLAPFSFSYYRQFGYEHVFDKINYTISAKDLKQLQVPKIKTGTLKKGPLNQFIETIQPLHARSSLTKHGGVIRDAKWWHYLTLKNDWDVVVYYDDAKKAQGYLIYERQALTLTIKEFVFETPLAQNALLNFIVKHQNSFETFVYEAPQRDYLGLFCPNPGILNAQIIPYMMARIVNLESFLTKYPFTAALDLYFTLSDPVLPENEETWHLKTDTHTTNLTKTTQKAQINLTIQQLSQICLGATTATKLANLGLVSVSDKACLAQLDQAFNQATPSLVDYF